MPTHMVIQLMTLPVSATYNTVSWQKLAGKMAKMLDDLGESEYRLAIDSLDNVKISSSKKMQELQIGKALGHLESAAEDFTRAAEEWREKTIDFRRIAFSHESDFSKMTAAWENVVDCYAMMVRIYVEQQNEKLAIKYSLKYYVAWYMYADCKYSTYYVNEVPKKVYDAKQLEALAYIAKYRLPFKKVFDKKHKFDSGGPAHAHIWPLESKAKNLAQKM